MESSYQLTGDSLARYREFAGDGLFRMSVGLEDADDICGTSTAFWIRRWFAVADWDPAGAPSAPRRTPSTDTAPRTRTRRAP